MTAKLESIIQYLAEQGIDTEHILHKPSFFDPHNEIVGRTIDWLPHSKQTDEEVDLKNTAAESMSLASMSAVQVFLGSHSIIQGTSKLLDVCAAPGMKSLYAHSLVPDIDLYCNDLSGDRLTRLNALLNKHTVKFTITKYDARFINRAYEPESFDYVLVDAPCSGEGVILGGSDKLLEAWSPAKVKRLQQLQIKILKSSWKLLKPGGRLVYATCTLNKNENERVVKKALGVTLDTKESVLSLNEPPMLTNNQAWRILPSVNSIGFFMAVLEKPFTSE